MNTVVFHLVFEWRFNFYLVEWRFELYSLIYYFYLQIWNFVVADVDVRMTLTYCGLSATQTPTYLSCASALCLRHLSTT